jgi:hypothetical protein
MCRKTLRKFRLISKKKTIIFRIPFVKGLIDNFIELWESMIMFPKIGELPVDKQKAFIAMMGGLI